MQGINFMNLFDLGGQLKKRNVIAWTINSKLEAIKMKNCCDTITFEGFKPI